MTRTSRLAALMGIAFAVAGFADATDLEGLRKKYDAALEEIVLTHGAAMAECNEQYAKSLDVLLSQVKKQGDLDRTKAVMAELERFKRDRTTPTEPNQGEDIRNRQAAYAKRTGELNADKATRIVRVVAQYDKLLLGLQKELTASDKLGEATAVQDERKRVEASDVVVSAKAVLGNASVSRSQEDKPAPMAPPEEPTSPREDAEVIGTVGGTVTQIQDVGHALQLWGVLPPYVRPGRYRLGVQHAVAGVPGSFRLMAWADKDGDGVPDKMIDQSEELSAKEAGEWSEWEFKTTHDSLFVGNCWSQSGEQIFYSSSMPGRYRGLGDEVFFSRSDDGSPTGRSRPRFTNIRLKFLGTR